LTEQAVSDASKTPTAQFASVIYGDGVAPDDAAERFHEAAKLYPSSAAQQLSGLRLLTGHAELQHSVERAGHRFPQLPGTGLPGPRQPWTPLARVLRRRRSLAPAAGSTIELGELSTVLAAALGLSRRRARRQIPSGGALYPLEAYVATTRVDGAPQALHHFDPYSNRLERLRSLDGELAGCLVDPSIAENAAAIVVLTAVFWRSRFKYGLRGYRFALLEAGHAAQNAILVGTALGLSVLPVGGFYDGRVEALLAVDGVNESPVYLLALGRP
jgi:SagB-type dehydrogenase family enzyme